MNAFSLTPSSLLSKNVASLRNPSLSYIWWFYFCLFLLEQFTWAGVFHVFSGFWLGASRLSCARHSLPFSFGFFISWFPGLHEPFVFLQKEVFGVAPDAAGVADPRAAGLQAGRPADIENPVDGVAAPVLPPDFQGEDGSV